MPTGIQYRGIDIRCPCEWDGDVFLISYGHFHSTNNMGVTRIKN